MGSIGRDWLPPWLRGFLITARLSCRDRRGGFLGYTFIFCIMTTIHRSGLTALFAVFLSPTLWGEISLAPAQAAPAASVAVAAAEAPAAPVIFLWSAGAPGFESRKDEPEQAQGYSINNIHNPSLTVLLPPKEKATGQAVIVVPGGGHRQLGFKSEGLEPAQYLNSLGIAAFVLKHRLAREPGSPYQIDVHAKQDGQRAMRVVRNRAAEWGVDPGKIGMMGFSAGGEVVSLVTYAPSTGEAAAADPIERVHCLPDFQIIIYPGPLGLPDRVAGDAPPAFFLCSDDDRSHAWVITRLTELYREAKRPVECHLLARGGHGYNLGQRSKLISVKSWTQRLTDWFADGGAASVPPTPDDQRDTKAYGPRFVPSVPPAK
jgi:acetyl esterase/lipase